MPKDWYKKYEQEAEDREEARRSQVTAASTPEPAPPKAAPVKTVNGVDSGTGGTCKHEGF